MKKSYLIKVTNRDRGVLSIFSSNQMGSHRNDVSQAHNRNRKWNCSFDSSGTVKSCVLTLVRTFIVYCTAYLHSPHLLDSYVTEFQFFWTMSIPDPWKPLQNSSNFVLPRSLPTSGIVTVFVINLVVFVVLFIAFLVLRKFFPDFYIPYSRPKRLYACSFSSFLFHRKDRWEYSPSKVTNWCDRIEMLSECAFSERLGLRNRSETDLLMKPNRSYREYTSNRSSPNDSFNDSLKRTRATNMALSYDSIGALHSDRLYYCALFSLFRCEFHRQD